MLESQLRRHGWHTKPVLDPEENTALRHKAFSFLGGLLGEPGLLGMPYGREGVSLWTYFLESFRIERSASLVKPGDAVVSQDARSLCYRIDRMDPGFTLPQDDLFVMSYEGIFATDHEDEGPWFISWKETPFALTSDTRRGSPTPIGLPAVSHFTEEQRGEVERWVVEALRGLDFWVPSTPLPNCGVGEDHLWNYIPWAFEIRSKKDRRVRAALRKSRVMVWTDDAPGASLVESLSLEDCLPYRNAYFLDWPERRWLFTVAYPCLHSFNDTALMPCFVPLR